MKTHQIHGGKEGGVLVLAMVVMLAFSILAIGMFRLHNTDALETVYVTHAQRAFWLAESGLDHVIRDLRWDPNSRDDSYIVTTNYSGMSYIGRVLSASQVGFRTTFTIQSVGEVQGVQRTVQQDVLMVPGAEASIVLKGGDSVFASNNDIYDPVIMFGGTLDTGNNSTSIFHDYIIGDSGNITGNGSSAGTADPPFPFDEPSMDPSGYDAQIPSVSAGTSPLTNGNTITFYDAMVNITDPVPDGTTLIVPQDIDFGNNHAVIGADVTILAGHDISFPGHSDVAPGTLIYARNDIEFSTHGSGDSALVGVTLLSSGGDITFASHVEFDGLIFADQGTVYLGSSAVIEGSIIGGVGLDKSATGNAGIGSVTIKYNSDVFMSGLPVSLDFGGLAVLRKEAGTWLEL